MTRKPLSGLAKFFIFLLSVVAAMIIVLVVALLLIGTPFFSAKLGHFLSGKSGREIALEGKIETHLWSSEPRFILHNVKVGNAAWAKEPAMFSAERIEISIRLAELLRGRVVLPEVIAEEPRLALEKNEQGLANWDFSENPDSAALKGAAPEHRSSIPIIRHLRIKDGDMIYRDPKKNIDTELAVDTASGGEGAEEMITLKGKGDYQKAPFLLELKAASILQLRESNQPYPFHLKTTVGKTEAEVEGTVEDPVKMEALDVRLHLKGANAADLFPLTGIVLPPSPPYSVEGHLTRDGKKWEFQDFKGRLGGSDLSGNLEFDTEQKPPYLKAEFVSNNLDMKDLSGFVGANKKPDDETRVIPDTPVDISRLNAMNADATFRGKHVKAPDLLDDFSMNLSLKDGTLTLKPVSFGIAKGKISADVVVEGQKNPPVTTLQVHFQRLSIASLFAPLAKRFGEENVSTGMLGGKASLKGRGKSLRDILGTSDGAIGIGMEGGRLSHLLLELVGLDLFRAAGLVISGDKPVAINCVVGDFGVEDGMMQSQQFLIDTDVTTIEGKGHINLKDEGMELRLTVHPKDPSLFSARTPIIVGGTLKHPKVGLDPAAAAARGGVAAALGVLLTPVGALLAFVEPGLGENSDCAKFLHQLDSKTGGAIPKNKVESKPAAAPAGQ